MFLQIVRQSIGLTTTQYHSNAAGTDKRTLKGAKHKNAVANDRPTGQPTYTGAGGVTRGSSPDDIGAGRKSGRLREKGTTTYTAKGEIMRGGKRMNDELHEHPFAKKVRYET